MTVVGELNCSRSPWRSSFFFEVLCWIAIFARVVVVVVVIVVIVGLSFGEFLSFSETDDCLDLVGDE